MARDISNADDIIDSRDVIARLEELTDERDELQDAEEAALETFDDAKASLDVDDEESCDALSEARITHRAAEAALAAWEADNGDEYRALKALADEAEGYAGDWHHGAALIRESYFTDYCKDMLEDCGDLPRDMPGYLIIDWDATADNLRVDYTEVDFDGVTYLVR